MKKAVKDKWVAALLSGEYKQGQGYLRTNQGFCCLGVLCDLASKEGVGHWGVEGDETETTDRTATPFFTSDCESSAWQLPTKVMHWAGMVSHNGTIFEMNLAEQNDNGRTFEDLACVIEGNYEIL